MRFSLDVILHTGWRLSFFVVLVILLSVCESTARGQRRSPFNAAPIHYDSTTPTDAISKLQQEINSGKKELKYNEKYGYLESVLKLLNIPASSQTLVFRKQVFRDLIFRVKNPGQFILTTMST